MENATKALLIAAAILIAILIISLALGIFSPAAEMAQNQGDLSEYEMQAHNDKFGKHTGENKTASEVNAMLKEVFNYNLTQDDTTTMVTVTDNLNMVNVSAGIDPTTMDADQEIPKVPTTSRYDVTATRTGGLITELIITPAS